ncbi:MAG: hypothetical protein LBG59_10115 [Candidatus Peribacteria bacterium]|nr:hypothetical protein [Candidatus Peribacteria bacterium]
MNSSGVAPGIYKGDTIILELETYDGEIIKFSTGAFYGMSPVSFNILNPSTLPNKMDLFVGSNGFYNPDIDLNYVGSAPEFRLVNPYPTEKHNQVMSFTIGTGYEVMEVGFPTISSSIPPTNVMRETWSGLTGTATGNQIVNKGSNNQKSIWAISISSLGLYTGESFKYVKASLGTLNKQILSNDSERVIPRAQYVL